MRSIIKLEEWINSMTHYLGVILALIGNGALLVHSYRTENTGYFVGSIIFTISLILLYTMSGTYHIVFNPKVKKIFKILDHSAIYILIAGSYTPYLLGVFEGNTKWIFFFVQWGMTLLGIFFKIFYAGRFKVLSTLIYLFMGWMIILVYKDLVVLIPNFSLKLLMTPDLFFTKFMVLAGKINSEYLLLLFNNELSCISSVFFALNLYIIRLLLLP